MKNRKQELKQYFESRKPLLSLAAAFGSSALLLAGCSKSQQDPAPISTRETENTRKEVEDFKYTSTPIQKSRVELAFAELDQEIHELEIRAQNTGGEKSAEAQRKLNDLKAQRDALRSDFTEEKFQALLKQTKEAVW